jgi:hypothetical protein
MDTVNYGPHSAASADEQQNYSLRHEAHDAPPRELGAQFIFIWRRVVCVMLEPFYLAFTRVA